MQCIMLTVSKAVRYRISIEIQNDSFIMIIRRMSEPVSFSRVDVRVNFVEMLDSLHCVCGWLKILSSIPRF